jgi:hypothetical protein
VRQWRAAGWNDARIALNVSASSSSPAIFLGTIERLLRRHDLPPECLELELTENMLQTGAITVETLHGLQLLGVATALDDFGTGLLVADVARAAAAEPRQARPQRRRRGRLEPRARRSHARSSRCAAVSACRSRSKASSVRASSTSSSAAATSRCRAT